MAVLKRSLSTSNGAAALNIERSAHPLKNDILRVNASKTRDHSNKYHEMLAEYNILKDINEPLLAWYGSRGDLPWRSDLSDDQLKALSAEEKAQRAYQVWVSEIMLQQTQVATVIPYYKRWIEAFPTVAKLSEASIDEVNSLWKGLGYYSRASRLLDGAKTVVKRYDSALPSEPEVLVKEIEGIGPYTAGAIASIAYGVQTPTVDGNIQRVICRFLAIYADMKKKPVLDFIWKRAEELVPAKRAGHWNQALMDLGATVCTPKNPKCGECPINHACLAYAETRTRPSKASKGDIEDLISSPAGKASNSKSCALCLPLDPPSFEREVTLYPLKVVKKKSREEDISVCVTRWKGNLGDNEEEQIKILLIKRPEKGLLAGLDEFPSVVMPDGESTPASRFEASTDLLREILLISDETLSLAEKNKKSLGSVKHIYSHINAMFYGSLLTITSDKLPKIRKDMAHRAKWVDEAAVDDANISTGHVKVWTLVKGGNTNAKSGKSIGSTKRTVVAAKTVEKGQMKLSFTKEVVSVKETDHTSVIRVESEQETRSFEVTEKAVSVRSAESRAKTASPRKKRRIDISSDEE